MTGFRDTSLETLVGSFGGILQSRVAGNTDLVVAKDVEGNSGKVRKAQEKGIKVINLVDFKKLF